jgi:CheY-like chemotaxis protein
MDNEYGSLRALVVDDYDNMRLRMTAAVEGLGITVDQAANGLEALKKLREDHYDLLFTDIVMPEMDGFELCEEVRNTPDLQHLLVIVASTHYDTSYIIKALRLGADDYVPKPVEPELVARVVARVMTPLAPAGEA